MTDELKVTIHGGHEIAAALREMRDELPPNILRSALRSSAERMRKVIIAFAPKRTRRLIDALSVRASNRGGIPSASVIVNTAGKRGDPENAFYWRFLEKGWHSRAGIPYREPFIEPAVRTETQDAVQNVVTVVERAIAKAEAKARNS